MTHPSGPGDGGGTSGPGRKPIIDETRPPLDEVAGSYWHATPLTAEQRVDRYARQNGGPRLTAKQRRRVGKKLLANGC